MVITLIKYNEPTPSWNLIAYRARTGFNLPLEEYVVELGARESKKRGNFEEKLMYVGMRLYASKVLLPSELVNGF